ISFRLVGSGGARDGAPERVECGGDERRVVQHQVERHEQKGQRDPAVGELVRARQEDHHRQPEADRHRLAQPLRGRPPAAQGCSELGAGGGPLSAGDGDGHCRWDPPDVPSPKRGLAAALELEPRPPDRPAWAVGPVTSNTDAWPGVALVALPIQRSRLPLTSARKPTRPAMSSRMPAAGLPRISVAHTPAAAGSACGGPSDEWPSDTAAMCAISVTSPSVRDWSCCCELSSWVSLPLASVARLLLDCSD